jgi:hypothetical protein
MSKKRIITFVNIFFSILLIVAVFLPITNKSLFDYDCISKYEIIVLSVISIIVNAINKKVHYTFLVGGFAFFYTLDFGWGIYGMLNYGYYCLLIPAFSLILLTLLYDLIDEPDPNAKFIRAVYTKRNKNNNNYIRPNYDNINKYPNVQMQHNMNSSYQNQMYPPGYNNYR